MIQRGITKNWVDELKWIFWIVNNPKLRQERQTEDQK